MDSSMWKVSSKGSGWMWVLSKVVGVLVDEEGIGFMYETLATGL